MSADTPLDPNGVQSAQDGEDGRAFFVVVVLTVLFTTIHSRDRRTVRLASILSSRRSVTALVLVHILGEGNHGVCLAERKVVQAVDGIICEAKCGEKPARRGACMSVFMLVVAAPLLSSVPGQAEQDGLVQVEVEPVGFPGDLAGHIPYC